MVIDMPTNSLEYIISILTYIDRLIRKMIKIKHPFAITNMN